MQALNNKKMTVLLALADDIIKISQQMISLAEHSEWEKFAELDTKRQSLVRSINLKEIDLTAEESAMFRDLMNEMITLNNTLSTLCIAQRSELADKLAGIRLGAKAKVAYS